MSNKKPLAKKKVVKKGGQKKPLKTIKEDSKGKNLKTINTKTNKVTSNKVLEKKAEKGKLPGYEVVKPKDKEKYLRSKKNKTKKDNLDFKVKPLKSNKVKKVVKKTKK